MDKFSIIFGFTGVIGTLVSILIALIALHVAGDVSEQEKTIAGIKNVENSGELALNRLISIAEAQKLLNENSQDEILSLHQEVAALNQLNKTTIGQLQYLRKINASNVKEINDMLQLDSVDWMRTFMKIDRLGGFLIDHYTGRMNQEDLGVDPGANETTLLDTVNLFIVSLDRLSTTNRFVAQKTLLKRSIIDYLRLLDDINTQLYVSDDSYYRELRRLIAAFRCWYEYASAPDTKNIHHEFEIFEYNFDQVKLDKFINYNYDIPFPK